MTFLALAFGAIVGAGLRAATYLTIGIKYPDFPIGSLIVNTAGSAILGFVVGLAVGGTVPRDVELLIAEGFCGALTTFSTFSYDAYVLMERREWNAFFTYLGGSVALGFGGAGVAYAAGLALS